MNYISCDESPCAEQVFHTQPNFPASTCTRRCRSLNGWYGPSVNRLITGPYTLRSHDIFLSQNLLKLGTDNEIEYVIAADEMQELTMTSLGKLVFGDIYDRQHKSLPNNNSLSKETLSLAYENMVHMPYDMIEQYSTTINTLDISNNKLSRNLLFLSEFDNLTSLNLDHNIIDEGTVFPYLPNLELLWLNHNRIETLYPFVKNLHESLPNLKYLALMGNKAAPSYINGGNFYDYLQYRLFVISWFPHLVHLDDRRVMPDQRKEAKRLFKRPFFDDVNEPSLIPQCIRKLHNKLANVFVRPDRMLNFRLRRRRNTII